MISVFPAGRAKTFNFRFENENGDPVAPVSASRRLLDGNNAEVLSAATLTVSGAMTEIDVLVDAAGNTLVDEKRGFRMLELTFSDASGNEYALEQHYVLEQPGIVEKGENSFDTYGKLILTSLNISGIEAFEDAPIVEQRAALINAWYNIGDVRLKNLGLEEEHQGRELTAALLDELDPDILMQLKRAQVIEANFILGGNPVEDRRRTGMISDSSGESAQFFRTSRPVELPICKAAANALRGRVDWGLNISR